MIYDMQYMRFNIRWMIHDIWDRIYDVWYMIYEIWNIFCICYKNKTIFRVHLVLGKNCSWWWGGLEDGFPQSSFSGVGAGLSFAKICFIARKCPTAFEWYTNIKWKTFIVGNMASFGVLWTSLILLHLSIQHQTTTSLHF